MRHKCNCPDPCDCYCRWCKVAQALGYDEAVKLFEQESYRTSRSRAPAPRNLDPVDPAWSNRW